MSLTPSPEHPYGMQARYHLHHPHLFASDLDATMAFYQKWFEAEVHWDGGYGGARNVFMKIGIGAIHFYEQAPRDLGRNAIHHLGFQVVGLRDLHARMEAAGIRPNPIREDRGSTYFMVEAPDKVLLEVFEPGLEREQSVLEYYGLSPSESKPLKP